MKILILSHYFWPEPIPKPLELAVALRDEGNTVEVVTGFPNYPSGELYPGFALRPLRRDRVEGIPVIRTFMYPSHGTSLFGRMLNYGSFMGSAIFGGLLARSFDVMYVWHPPLSIGVAATAIGLLRRRAFVYDVQDIWPESAIETGFLRQGRVVDWMARLEKFVYSRAAHILVVTDGAKANLVGKGVPGTRITVVPHWYDDTDLRSLGQGEREAVRARVGWRDRFVVMFAGNMGLLQGLDTVVDACRGLPADSNVMVAMVGDGVDTQRLKSRAGELGINHRIQFVSRQPAAMMAGYFAAADALLVHLRASALSPLIIPSKTVAYLAAGKPIVMAGVGAAAEIVEKAGAGVVLPPGNPEALCKGMLKVAKLPPDQRQEMGRRGREYFEAHFTKRATLPIYLEALRGAARRSAGAAD
jgi:colanic acid biosynthesis glycosyl transferase WcaI